MTESVDIHFLEHAELTDLSPLLAGERLPASSEPAMLARLVEDPDVSLRVRLAAGAVLAVYGDPRLPVVPAVLPVPGGDVEIGLAADQVEAVAAKWRYVGVQQHWIEKELPVWPTHLHDFWLGRYPVTNVQYLAFLRLSGWDGRPSTWYLGAYPWDRANHPVSGVAAEDADAYLAWLSERTGHPYRLPTEAEWEHAAKGFGGSEYPWGAEFDPAKANTRESGVHTTSPVGAFPGGTGPFGHADLSGNVEEYVADRYRPYPGGTSIEDHLTELLGGYRVTRGGSFARYGDLARTRRRHGAFPSPLYPCGFRIATARPALGASSDQGNSD